MADDEANPMTETASLPPQRPADPLRSGLPFGILGVILLGRNSVWGHRWMESVLKRHPRVERFAPNWLMKLVFAREKNVAPPRKR